MDGDGGGNRPDMEALRGKTVGDGGAAEMAVEEEDRASVDGEAVADVAVGGVEVGAFSGAGLHDW
jgi:hypothetical protein